MSPRPPSEFLVTDANIILSCVLGRKTQRVFETVRAARNLIASERTRDEVLGKLASLAGGDAGSLLLAKAIIAHLVIVDTRAYRDLLAPAARALRHAPPSGNGSERDAHVLALAWLLDADIWSHDRDFAGTGWPTWSNANLMIRIGSGTP